MVLLERGLFVVVTASGAVEARDAATGEFRWKLGLPGESLFPPGLYRAEPFAILLSSARGNLFLVDAASGGILAEADLGFELALPPLVDLPRLYFGTTAGELVAFDFEKKREDFKAPVGEPSLALARSGETLIASGSERTLTAIDTASGVELWRLRGRSPFAAPATFARDRVYVGNDAGDFYSLSLEDGNPKFRWATGAAIRFAPLVEDRLVYLTSFGNELYAYDAGGGSEQFRVPLPGRPASSPFRFGARLVIATYDGALVEVDTDKAAVTKTFTAPSELGASPAFLPSRGPESNGAGGYAAHRIALPLRTGEVLLLGHQAEKPEPEPPGREDSLSWK
jgi:outer membrane protein assembly factor BamB